MTKIALEDGRVASIVGQHLVFGVGDSVGIATLRPTPLASAIDVSLDGIAAPVMFAELTLPEGPARAAMSLQDYNRIAIAGAQPSAAPAPSGPARFVQAATRAVERRFGGCCGRK